MTCGMIEAVAHLALVLEKADFLAILRRFAREQLDRQPLARQVIDDFPNFAGLALANLVQQPKWSDVVLWHSGNAQTSS